MQRELTMVVRNIARPRCTMSLTKVPFLTASAVGVYVAQTPPQPKVPPTARPKTVTSYERVFSSLARSFAGSLKILAGVGGSLEICVILASRFPIHPLSQKILDALVPHPLDNTGRIGFSPIFLVGCSIATLGGFHPLQMLSRTWTPLHV